MLSQSARPPLPLARYPRVNTTDFDEAAQLYASLVTPVRITRTVRRTPFSWRGNQLSLGPLSVSANEFAGGVSAESEGPVGDYHISIPLAEARGEACFASNVVPITRGKSALLSSPGDCATIVLQPGYQGLGLNIARGALLEAMATLTGSAPRSIRFHHGLALDSAKLVGLLRLVRELVANADLAAPPSSRAAAARIAEPLLFQLLLCQPHNQEAMLSARVQAAEPRYVRRAVEYLEANLARTITMAELTRETGIGARSLQLGFQRSRGCSPLQFLQQRRLQHARILLLTGDARVAVSEVAQLAGFHHMGRFSVQYRTRFGETPTDTRARRRKR